MFLLTVVLRIGNIVCLFVSLDDDGPAGCDDDDVSDQDNDFGGDMDPNLFGMHGSLNNNSSKKYLVEQ